GIEEVSRVLEAAARAAAESLGGPGAMRDAASAQDAVRAAIEALRGTPLRHALYADYPLIYVTGPDPRDIDLTGSQINTHKIRGAITIVVAEENAALASAGGKPPADNPSYRHVYVKLPATGDTLMTAFSATVALQRLALKMSLLKMQH